MSNSKMALPEGFSFETLSNDQLALLGDPGYIRLKNDAARRTALLEVAKSGYAGDDEEAEGEGEENSGQSGEKALRNPSNRRAHARHSDTYWEPNEIRRLTDTTLKSVRKDKLAQDIEAGILEETTMGKMAYGVVTLAPAPTPQKPEVTGEKGNEGSKEGDEDSDDGESDDLDPSQDLPEGYTYDSLSAEQLSVVQDDKFFTLPENEQKKLLQLVAQPEASGPEENKGATFVSPEEAPTPQDDADF